MDLSEDANELVNWIINDEGLYNDMQREVRTATDWRDLLDFVSQTAEILISQNLNTDFDFESHHVHEEVARWLFENEKEANESFSVSPENASILEAYRKMKGDKSKSKLSAKRDKTDLSSGKDDKNSGKKPGSYGKKSSSNASLSHESFISEMDENEYDEPLRSDPPKFKVGDKVVVIKSGDKYERRKGFVTSVKEKGVNHIYMVSFMAEAPLAYFETELRKFVKKFYK